MLLRHQTISNCRVFCQLPYRKANLFFSKLHRTNSFLLGRSCQRKKLHHQHHLGKKTGSVAGVAVLRSRMDDGLHFNRLHDLVYYIGAWLTWTSSSLSIYGSSSIVYIILKKRKWKKSAFHRIMMSWSISDIIVSLACFLQPFLVPSFTNLHFALGNIATCQVVGFLNSFFLATFLHGAITSLYFCLTIRLRWSEARVERCLEPWIYILPWSVSLVYGILGASYRLFYPDVMLHACVLTGGHDPLGHHYKPRLLTWLAAITTYPPLVASMLSMIFTALVFQVVYTQTYRNGRYANGVSEVARQRMRAVAIQAICYEGAFLLSFVSLLAPLLLSIMGDFADPTYDVVPNAVVQAALLLVFLAFPLQGFLNWMVFVRPMLVRWRDAHPDKSWWWAYCQILLGRSTPTTLRTSSLTNKARTCYPTDGTSGPLSPAFFSDEQVGAFVGSPIGKRSALFPEGNNRTAFVDEETATPSTQAAPDPLQNPHMEIS